MSPIFLITKKIIEKTGPGTIFAKNKIDNREPKKILRLKVQCAVLILLVVPVLILSAPLCAAAVVVVLLLLEAPPKMHSIIAFDKKVVCRVFVTPITFHSI